MPESQPFSWTNKRSEFQARFDRIVENHPQDLLRELTGAIGTYVRHAGIHKNSTSNPEYTAITTAVDKIVEIKNKFFTLNSDIISYLKPVADASISEYLTRNGTLQQQILQLQKVKDEMKVDVDSAIARDELLRSKDADISSHSLFFLDRPVRRGMIPYLWIFSILFIGVGIVILKMYLPSVGTDVENVFVMIYSLFSDKIILIVLLIVSIITIILLSLKVTGVFGK